MRTHAEWNVDTHIFSATGPTNAPTRCFISSAALFVNVMARISNGLTPRSWIRWAMRVVRTFVLPLPAPATISSGPAEWVAASRWTGLSPVRNPSLPPSSKGPGAGVSKAAATSTSYNLGICTAPGSEWVRVRHGQAHPPQARQPAPEDVRPAREGPHRGSPQGDRQLPDPRQG